MESRLYTIKMEINEPWDVLEDLHLEPIKHYEVRDQ
jgi:hypothetical protein